MPTTNSDARSPTVSDLRQQARKHFKDKRWDLLARLACHIPEQLTVAWAELAESASFGLSRIHEQTEAIALLKRAFEFEPTARRASSLAYLHYDALMDMRQPAKPKRRGKKKKAKPVKRLEEAPSGPRLVAVSEVGPDGRTSAADASRGASQPRDTQAGAEHGAKVTPGHAAAAKLGRDGLREGFREYIAIALDMCPGSVKDLYRLGQFESQLENAHDRVALRAFLGALDSYHAMEPAERERRHDLRKYVARSYYAGGRSALRLGELDLARRLSFNCIRFDQDRDFVEPVHKLGLAGRVCLMRGELDHAERAFRLALDAKGPPRRGYLYGYLCDVEMARKRPEAAARYIEAHIRPERRSAPEWRRLGHARRAMQDLDGAKQALESCLMRDRKGRHLTFTELGTLHLETGDLRNAKRCFEQADAFRRRQYQSPHRPALAGLEQVKAARADRAATHGVPPGVAKAPTVPPRAAEESSADEERVG